MKYIYLISALLLITGCRKEKSMQDEIDAKKYNADASIKFDKTFFDKNGYISGVVQLNQQTTELSVEVTKIHIKTKSGLVEANNSKDFSVPSESVGETVTVQLTYQDGTTKEFDFTARIMETTKVDDIWDDISPALFDDWDNKSVITINKEMDLTQYSGYIESRDYNIFPFAGLLGVTYLYFNNDGKLESVKIFNGNMNADPSLTILEVLNDVEKVYGELSEQKPLSKYTKDLGGYTLTVEHISGDFPSRSAIVTTVIPGAL